ncbi:MAG: low molecular weight phosphotyrosine protein phosphatase [Bacteroides sp.]|nr:low molecular weight phosphotyrosine protein phosphatase [Bacteroides sp.]
MGNNSANRESNAIHALKHSDKIRVLFVCLGNICRSPAAEGVLRSIIDAEGDSSRWIIDSAGTYGGHAGDLPDRRMRIHAQRRGYDLTHRSRQFRQSDFDNFDLIIPMDASNERDLRAMAPTVEAEAKIVPMIKFVGMATRYDHVPDPYYEGAEGFELVLDLLEDGCRNLYETLSASK